MVAAPPLQLSPAVVGAIQWTLAGIELLVLAWVVVWIGRNSRLGRLARPFRRRTTLSAEASDEVASASRARLVSGGGHAIEPIRTLPAPRPASRTPRLLRTTRTPPRAHPTPPASSHAWSSLHCPGCGALLARGEVATRLVTRCPGCDRRVAVRHDGARVVVTIEG